MRATSASTTSPPVAFGCCDGSFVKRFHFSIVTASFSQLVETRSLGGARSLPLIAPVNATDCGVKRRSEHLVCQTSRPRGQWARLYQQTARQTTACAQVTRSTCSIAPFTSQATTPAHLTHHNWRVERVAPVFSLCSAADETATPCALHNALANTSAVVARRDSASSRGTAQRKRQRAVGVTARRGRVQDARNMLTHIVGCNALQRSTKAVCSTLTRNFNTRRWLLSPRTLPTMLQVQPTTDVTNASTTR
jgi:hypothetical protein